MNTQPNDRTKLAAMIAASMEIDRLVAKHTAAKTLAELLDEGGNYRPSINSRKGQRGAELDLIAGAYDKAQASLGDDRRAYRS